MLKKLSASRVVVADSPRVSRRWRSVASVNKPIMSDFTTVCSGLCVDAVNSTRRKVREIIIVEIVLIYQLKSNFMSVLLWRDSKVNPEPMRRHLLFVFVVSDFHLFYEAVDVAHRLRNCLNPMSTLVTDRPAVVDK